MSGVHNDVRATAQMLLNRTAAIRDLVREDIVSAVASAVQLFDSPAVDSDAIVRELESSYRTIIGVERSLVDQDKNYEPWLHKKKSEISWRFWTRYEQHLLRDKGWPTATLQRLDASTDTVLGLLTDPLRSASWDRRGMIVGDVQSGKTAHYAGLICKAADAGYKLIVVLAGFHKSLRSQTQIRLEEGFLGYDRAAFLASAGTGANKIGVGNIDPLPQADAITTRSDDGDFKRQVAQNFGINPGGHPLLFVVKKNNSVLRNLLGWVQFAANAADEAGNKYVKGVPLLVIDDEADQGSVDTKEGAFNEDGSANTDHDPTALNRSIRRLLHLFDQSAYGGYTATPFANIFIHEQGRTLEHGEDLFPRSFIVSLPTPSTYMGAAAVFGYDRGGAGGKEALPIIRIVGDHADSGNDIETQGWMPPKHNKQHIPRVAGFDDLPDTLKLAVQSFILTCAARMGRGQTTAHNSMLIHVTRFTAVQAIVAEQVKVELRKLNNRLRYGDGSARDQIRDQLERLWEEDFEPTTSLMVELGYKDSVYQRWTDVEPFVEQAAASISVREINGYAGEVLDYVAHETTGLNVIAVGGDKLSRGLTLEGLSVSYFLRASRMYDTLMQMGRWFGYRPGYADLCRLFTTPDLTEWFSHIAAASDELREDFDRMVASGGTPKDFGHRVKSHPSLLVTSQVKMRNGTEIELTFDGSISETINFWRDKDHLAGNWQAALTMVSAIEASGSHSEPVGASSAPARQHIWRSVEADHVLNFLSSYKEHDASIKVKTKLLADYIRAEVGSQRLTTWTVLLAGGSSVRRCQLGQVADVRQVERNWFLNDSTTHVEKKKYILQNHFRIRRLVNPADEAADLKDDEREAAAGLTLANWLESGGNGDRPARPGGTQIRATRSPSNGLLIIYPIDGANSGDEVAQTAKVDPQAEDTPVLGFAISFPYVRDGTPSRVRYVVNNVYYAQEFEPPVVS